MPKKKSTPANLQSSETTNVELELNKTKPTNKLTTLPTNSFKLDLPEVGINLVPEQLVTIEFETLADVKVKGIYTLESNLFEVPLSEEHKALIEEGYMLDESFEPQPIFQTILNIVERQTHTRFFLRKKATETYIVKFGEYVDFDGDTRYGWYLVLTGETNSATPFIRPLTKEFIGLYLLSPQVRGE